MCNTTVSNASIPIYNSTFSVNELEGDMAADLNTTRVKVRSRCVNSGFPVVVSPHTIARYHLLRSF
jgi:hypothetical protein